MENIVFLDMDGTLSGLHSEESEGSTLWSKIAIKLDVYDKKTDVDDKYYSGKIDTYSDWVDNTMSLYEKHGLTKEVFYDVLSEIEYNNGVPEALERIHANDIKTVVITGGFKAQADEVRQKFGIDSAVAGCECNWAESGELSDLNVIPLGKFGKMRIVEAYANGYNVTPDQCVYVGDGENDSLALNECGLGIAYNGHELAVKNSDVQINGTHNKEFRLIADEVIDFFE